MNINVITAEINAYQRIAGEAIFEIGRRLKHVKENDLAHGEYTPWLKTVGIDESSARRFVKVYEEFSDKSKRGTYHGLGLRALYEIATIPPAERQAEHVTSKGETKTPDEMTVKELRELKSKLRETEKQAEAERQAEHVTSKGESKKPEDMTVKELRELKRSLKEEQEAREI